jgi:hypothetical protein
MNKRTYAKRQMVDTVLLTLTGAIALFLDWTAMLTLIKNLKEAADNLDTNIQAHLTAAVGKPAAKSDLRIALELLLCRIAAAVYLYSKENKMFELKALTNLRKNSITRMTDPKLAHISSAIADASSGIASNLGDYKITQADVDALKTTSTEFSKAKTAKAGSVDSKGWIMTDVNGNVQVIDGILDDIDRLMEDYRATNPGFYESYTKARKLPFIPVRHRKPKTNTPPAAKDKPVNPGTSATNDQPVNHVQPIDPEKPASE